jgi:hypothetical protein
MLHPKYPRLAERLENLRHGTRSPGNHESSPSRVENRPLRKNSAAVGLAASGALNLSALSTLTAILSFCGKAHQRNGREAQRCTEDRRNNILLHRGSLEKCGTYVEESSWSIMPRPYANGAAKPAASASKYALIQQSEKGVGLRAGEYLRFSYETLGRPVVGESMPC